MKKKELEKTLDILKKANACRLRECKAECDSCDVNFSEVDYDRAIAVAIEVVGDVLKNMEMLEKKKVNNGQS